ncbi:MAG TPA: PPK2 family polyphosphate kinase [Candidatus Nitrosocosmicus sp.]|nr:PPK2 family polyphosphate kinase [Candidatus Nitrosocosmicus sp.]
MMDPYITFQLNYKSQAHQKLNLDYWDLDLDLSEKHSKSTLEKELVEVSESLFELQYKLYAENKRSLLVVLQGIDASGKDGTVRHVMRALNPQNCYIKSFNIPNDEELSHDYLWRIHKAIPRKGQICIFNRSHYEDLTEPVVVGSISRKILKQRYRQINEFERYLSENDIVILKIFLYISKPEQKKRLLARIQDPNRRWKISESDVVGHKNYQKYMDAYKDIFKYTNKKSAPWFIIPANTKYFRNWAVSKILLKTLESMKPEYPRINLDPNKFNLS